MVEFLNLSNALALLTSPDQKIKYKCMFKYEFWIHRGFHLHNLLNQGGRLQLS